jgi:hypothetical protein
MQPLKMVQLGRRRRRRSAWVFGFCAGVTAALLCGFLWGRFASPRFEFPQVPLRAMATHGSETMAIATGLIDEGEGLFVLDYVTGDLFCFVLNPRANSKFNARYHANVVSVLGVEQGKKPNFVMVTGGMDFLRGAALARPGNCVVYVADTITGNFAAWGVPWNRTSAQQGRPQQGALVLLDVGKARNLEVE